MRVAALSVLAALAAAPGAANAQQAELPSRRPGHWEIKMLMEGRPGGPEMVMQACTDAETERMMMRFGTGQMGQTCQRYDIRRVGNEVHIDTDCQMGPMRSTARAVMSGDFQTSYTVRIDGTVTMPGQPQPTRTQMVQEGRFTSATCTGGLVPGDIQMPTGQKVNIRNMPGAAGDGATQPRRP